MFLLHFLRISYTQADVVHWFVWLQAKSEDSCTHCADPGSAGGYSSSSSSSSNSGCRVLR
jgi:hypothetical protein